MKENERYILHVNSCYILVYIKVSYIIWDLNGRVVFSDCFNYTLDAAEVVYGQS